MSNTKTLDLPSTAKTRLLRIGLFGWLKTKKDDGQSKLIGPTLRGLLNIYHFHQKERFSSALKAKYHTIANGWRLLPFERSMLQRIFYVYTVQDINGKQVIKIPRGDNQYSQAFINAIRNDSEFTSYKNRIENAHLDPWLGKHYANVMSVNRDGGYTSEFIEGYNLAHLRDVLFSENEFPKHLQSRLAESIKELLIDLNNYRTHNGKLIGDWALHNLIYSPQSNSIINVDLEGLYSFKGGSFENELKIIEHSLLDLVEFLRLNESDKVIDHEVVNTIRILDEVRQGGKAYSGLNFLVGYHSIQLNGRLFRGQRDCWSRLSKVPFNFENKVIVDLGCNSGGMLFALSSIIKNGYGFDYNPKCVNAALGVKKLNQTNNIDFYNFDLDKDSLSSIPLFLNNKKIDICFLLSVCMWLDRWREVISSAADMAEHLLFESNGTPEQQSSQVAELRRHFHKVEVVNQQSNDDPLQSERLLYLCSERI